MIALILHATEQSKITKFQKELCAETNSSLFPYLPFWFELPQDFTLEDEINAEVKPNELKSKLKEISDKISSINIEIIYSKEKHFPELKLNLSSNGKVFTSHLPLFIEYKKLNSEQQEELYKKLGSSEIFPMSLKIFRVGKVIRLSEKSQGITTFVWKKLK